VDVFGPADADIAESDTPTVDTTAPDVPDTAAATTAVWVHHPQAKSLILRGNTAPLSWSADFAPIATTATAARFDLPATGKGWQVKPMLGSAWSIGANHVVTAGKERHIYPYFDAKLSAPHRDDWNLPDANGKPRTIRVRLPPGYDENSAAKYPLLLMFDAQNVWDDETATFGVSWELDEALDAQMAAAKLGEVVVAAVDHGGAARIDEYTPWKDPKYGGGGGEKHLQWLHDKVLPALHGKYRLLPCPAACTIGGSSLGGLMSLYAVGAWSQDWGSAIAMSGSWWWNSGKTLTWLPTTGAATSHPRTWLDAGDQDDGLDGAEKVRDTMLGLGWQLDVTLGWFVAKGKGHNEQAWSERVHLPLQFHFDPHDRVPAF
jgi:predicted alpha/beta superfamily hydrolase